MDSAPKTLKIVTRVHYPRQICFTPKFLKLLKDEYMSRQYLQTDNNENKPVSKYKEKFIKAINFYLSQL